MKHRIGYNKLDRKASHRKAMINNMVTSLFRHERITTTVAKAREVRRTAEKMVTRAKTDSVHNRRLIAKRIKDKAVLNKLFTEISVRFKERPGGYTRVLRIGTRTNDAAEMSILELVDKVVEEKKKPKKAAAVEEEAAVVEEEAAAVEEKAVAVEEEAAAADTVVEEPKEEAEPEADVPPTESTSEEEIPDEPSAEEKND